MTIVQESYWWQEDSRTFQYRDVWGWWAKIDRRTGLAGWGKDGRWVISEISPKMNVWWHCDTNVVRQKYQWISLTHYVSLELMRWR